MISVRLLAAFAGSYPGASFVEIGANDGELHDPIQPYIRSRQWRGVMVEPVPYLCERLRHNYAAEADRVAIENAAIDSGGGRRPFYYLRPESERHDLPHWYHGLGSFDRRHLLESAGGDRDAIERLIVEAEVACLSLAELCSKHGIDRLDLLLIDAEGHDWEILRSVDFGDIHPRLLVFEHHNLGEADLAECEGALRAAGYHLVRDGLDTWCLDLSPHDPLSASWSEAISVSTGN